MLLLAIKLFLLAVTAALGVVGVHLLWGAFDYVGFGLILTKQTWGDPHQNRPYSEVPGWQKALYRVAQAAFQLLTLVVLVKAGPLGLAIAIGSVVSFPFMPHDLAYHFVGGHFDSDSYNPFGLWDKKKPWSAHYWILRAWVIHTGRDLGYDGVPARWETYGRIFGLGLGMGVAVMTAVLLL
jgi:hypothetical protein